MNGHSKLIAISTGNGQWFAAELPVDQCEPKVDDQPPPKPETLPAVVSTDTTPVAPIDPIAEISSMLGKIIAIMRELPPADARRGRDLLHSTLSMSYALTYLPDGDQETFEEGLRNAAQKRSG